MTTEATEVTAPEPSPVVDGGEAVAPIEATPEAPAVVETALVEEGPESPPVGKMEAKAAMRRENIRKAEAAKAAEVQEPAVADSTAVEPATPVVDEKGREHDPKTGHFLPADGGEQTTEAPPAEAGTADQVAEPAAEGARPEPIRIAIDQDHDLRNQGVTEIKVVDPKDEQAIRAWLNSTGVRKRDLEEARRERDEARAENRQHKDQDLRREVDGEVLQEWQKTDQYKAYVEEYENVRDSVGQGPASRMWQGIQPELRALQEQAFGARMESVDQERRAQAGEVWVGEAWSHTTKLPEGIRNLPDFRQLFGEAVEDFGDAVKRGRYPEIKEVGETAHDEFTKFFAQRLQQRPAVQDLLSKSKEAADRQRAQNAVKTQRARAAEAARVAAAAKGAVDDFKRGAAETRAAAPPNPLGTIPSQPTVGQTAGEAPEAELPQNEGPYARRQRLKTESRDRQRARRAAPV